MFTAAIVMMLRVSDSDTIATDVVNRKPISGSSTSTRARGMIPFGVSLLPNQIPLALVLVLLPLIGLPVDDVGRDRVR